MARLYPVSLQLWVAADGALPPQTAHGALPLRPERPGHCPVLHLHRWPSCTPVVQEYILDVECRAWARRRLRGRCGERRSSEASVPSQGSGWPWGAGPSTPHLWSPSRLLAVFIHGRELPEAVDTASSGLTLHGSGTLPLHLG